MFDFGILYSVYYTLCVPRILPMKYSKMNEDVELRRRAGLNLVERSFRNEQRNFVGSQTSDSLIYYM